MTTAEELFEIWQKNRPGYIEALANQIVAEVCHRVEIGEATGDRTYKRTLEVYIRTPEGWCTSVRKVCLDLLRNMGFKAISIQSIGITTLSFKFDAG